MIQSVLGSGTYRRSGASPKPPVGSPIASGNTLANGLLRMLSLSEGAGDTVYESVSGMNTVSPSGLAWRGEGDFVGLDMRTLNDLAFVIPSGTARTVFGVFRLNSYEGYATYGAPIGVRGNGDTHGLRRVVNGSYDLVFFNEAQQAVYGSGGPGIGLNVNYGWAWGYDGAFVRGSVAIGGGSTEVSQVVRSANSSGTLVPRSGVRTAFANDGVMDGTMLLVAVWDRWLSDIELSKMANDPYGLFLQ